MLNKFTLRPSTYNTFKTSSSPGRETVPFPSPKVTFPPFLDSKTLKKERSPVICQEHPLSRYHKYVSITINADFIIKHTLCLHDKSVGMVFFLICYLRTPLSFNLLRQTSLHIFILKQSSFFFVILRPFSISLKITFK